MRLPVTKTLRFVVLLLAVSLAGVACDGGAEPTDDAAPDDAATPADDVAADDEAFCDAALALGAPGEPDVDWETATDEEIAAAQQIFAEEELRPVVDDLRASAPEEVQPDVDTLEGVLDEAAEGGELEAFFEGEGGDARNAIAVEAAQRCGWESVDVTMVDYDFEGVPETLPAGPAFFTAVNEGEEAHEMIVFRKQDGVEQSWEELVALPEEEAMQLAEFVTAGFAPVGEETSAAAELAAGEYAMMCFIPVGTDATGAESGDGPPHFEEGMLRAFTVE